MRSINLPPSIQAYEHVSMKAPEQPTKRGMWQVAERKRTCRDGVQEFSALAGVEGNTS
jgi:hypothetical protein